jgi:hypothetical protein
LLPRLKASISRHGEELVDQTVQTAFHLILTLAAYKVLSVVNSKWTAALAYPISSQISFGGVGPTVHLELHDKKMVAQKLQFALDSFIQSQKANEVAILGGNAHLQVVPSSTAKSGFKVVHTPTYKTIVSQGQKNAARRLLHDANMWLIRSYNSKDEVWLIIQQTRHQIDVDG